MPCIASIASWKMEMANATALLVLRAHEVDCSCWRALNALSTAPHMHTCTFAEYLSHSISTVSVCSRSFFPDDGGGARPVLPSLHARHILLHATNAVGRSCSKWRQHAGHVLTFLACRYL